MEEVTRLRAENAEVVRLRAENQKLRSQLARNSQNSSKPPSSDPPSPALLEACPSCGKPSLWAKPVPRHVRFHDTRHSGGTAVVRSAGMAIAQKFLRHSDVRLTIHTYGHLDVEDVREGLSRSFTTGPVQVRTAGGLREGSEANGSAKLRTGGTAEDEPQVPVASADSGSDSIRKRARRGRSAASARTRCSSAA